MAFGLPLGLYVAALAVFPLNTPERLDAMAEQWLGYDLAGSPYRYIVYTAFLLLVAFIAVNYTAVFGGVSTWVERRVAGRMQSRIGPNRPGAAGFLSWVADAVKMILKEDTIPAEADHLLFRAAPYFSMVGLLLPFVVLPFGEATVVTDMNVGVFYVAAASAFVVVGILVSGWASNSKWALFGGIRGAAQVMSYEIPAGIAMMVPVLMAGTLSMQGIVRAQGGWPWQWFVFQNPAAFVAFFIAVTASLAEGNRTPFDLPEAESELVAGYHAEYSGFRLAIFLMVEWANMWIMAGLAVTLFLGGWQVPGYGAEDYARLLGTGLLPAPGWFGLQLLSMLMFVVKTWALVFVFIWLRWTLPRVRVDQMMSLCWKYLVPGAFLCFVVTLVWQLLVPPAGVAFTGYALTALALFVLAKFAVATRRNISKVAGHRVDLGNW
ncbi:MAG: NADH-quinone oxidoreductase subunit NuoH [Deltaproteobacteria bacterium]|nr:NADH-quinone oxidoreductase subunit NuoH [Deltaproteobacteria bacterium]